MSLSREVLMELMAYADGELDDDERARIEAILAESEEARAVVASVDVLGDFVRTSADAGADAADGIAVAVMARLETESVPAMPAMPSELERARAKRAASMRVVAAAAAITALAAGYVLLARPAAAPGPSAALAPLASPPPVEVAAAVPSAGAPDESATAALVPSASGVDVEHVEAPNNPVSVMYFPAVMTADVNASSVVIWITDDKGSGGH